MPATTPDALPYPAQTDPPNGPAQLQALAEQTQAVIAAHRAAADPHPVYLTQAEGDARFVQPAAVSKAVKAPLDNPKVTWGEHTVTLSSAIPVGSASGAHAVAFTASYFTQAPNVVATLSTIVGGTAGLVARVANITKNGFEVVYYNVGSATIAAGTVARANWQAIGY